MSLWRLFLRPIYFPQQTKQPLPSWKINRFNKTHLSPKVLPKMSMALAILCLGTKANAVVQDRLEAIEVGANDVRVLVRHNPDQMLPNSTSHNPRFTMVHVEAFLQQDRGHMK